MREDTCIEGRMALTSLYSALVWFLLSYFKLVELRGLTNKVSFTFPSFHFISLCSLMLNLSHEVCVG